MTACLHIMKGDEYCVRCILLGIDPGENSLHFSPSRPGTSEAGHWRAPGRVAEGSWLSKSHYVLTPGTERRTAGRGCLLSPEDVGAWMAVREGGVRIGPKTEGEGHKAEIHTRKQR